MEKYCENIRLPPKAIEMKERNLYADVKNWLDSYLKERYRNYQIDTTYESSRKSLGVVLKEKNVIIEEAIGLSIKIDVMGILKKENDIKLVFIEIKNEPLTLKDLGQLWGYTQLINPVESFLISSEGLGALEYLFRVLKREDLLYYGPKRANMMKVAKWDVVRKTIDYDSLIPKL
jgi:uncharacterized membrane protein YheB (UPF0754 family)